MKRHAGMFKKGQSGNPAGRPKGATVAKHYKDIVGEARLKKIILKVADEAESGDMRAAKILLDRAYPVPRGVSEPIHIEGLAEATTTEERVQAVFIAIGSAQLSPHIGAHLISVIKAIPIGGGNSLPGMGDFSDADIANLAKAALNGHAKQ